MELRVLPPQYAREALQTQAIFATLAAIYALTLYLNVDAWRSHDQFFVERDPSLSHPNLASTVSNAWLGVTAVAFPSLAIAAVAVRRVVAGRRVIASGAARDTDSEDSAAGGGIAMMPSDANFNSRAKEATLVASLFELAGAVQALCLTMGTYNGLKAFVGRLRPNFFAACDYKGYATAMATGDYASYLAATTAGAVGDRAHCLANEAATDEASLSFPSGHAALSFVAATYTAMALSEGFGRGVCRRGASETAEGRGLRGLLPNGVSPASAASCLTFAFASYVAASRITDYKHRPADVLAGAAIGVAFGVACRPRGTSRWWRMRVFGGGGGDGGRDNGFVTMT